MIISGARYNYNSNKDYYKNILSSFPKEYKYPFDKKIKLDISRTFPIEIRSSLPNDAENKLYNVLTAFSLRTISLGYCQGFNNIAARMLIITNFNEEEAFWLMVAVIEDCFPYDYFLCGAGVEVDCELVIDIIENKNKELFKNISKIGGISIVKAFIIKWLTSLFIFGIDFDISNSLYDIFFLYRQYKPVMIPYDCCNAIFGYFKDELMQRTKLKEIRNILNSLGNMGENKDKFIVYIKKKMIFNRSFALNEVKDIIKEREKRLMEVINNLNEKKELKKEDNNCNKDNICYCDVSWPLCVLDKGFKSNFSPFILYKCNINNGGCSIEENYFFNENNSIESSAKEKNDLPNDLIIKESKNNNLHIYNALLIERRCHLCKNK